MPRSAWPPAPRVGTPQPEGQLTWGIHVSLAPTWFDPAETPGHHHPVHDPLRAARRDGEADAGPAAGAVPGRVVVGGRGRALPMISCCARARNSTTATRSPPRTSNSRSSATAAPRTTLMKDRVAAIETPDPQHVRFKLKAPWPDFLTFYATATGAGWIVPKKYVEKVGDDGFKKAPIGAGPYKFVSFTPGRRTGVRGLRPVLAQDPERQAPGVQGRSPTRRPGWRRSSAARSTSSTRSAANSPRSCAARRGSP